MTSTYLTNPRKRPGWPVLLLPWLLLVLVVGTAQAQGENDEDDEELYEARIELVERIAEAHFERAWLLSEQDDLEAAIEELGKIERLPLPAGPEVDEQLLRVEMTKVELYLEAERFGAAEAQAQRALERFRDRDPQLVAELYLLLGHSLRGLDRSADALAAFDQAIALGHRALQELDDD